MRVWCLSLVVGILLSPLVAHGAETVAGHGDVDYAVVARVAKALGTDLGPLEALPAASPADFEPFAPLITLARQHGLTARVCRARYDDLSRFKAPLVALLWSGQAVSVDTSDPLRVRALDGVTPPQEIAEKAFRSNYAGLVLMLAPREELLPASPVIAGPDMRLQWYAHDFGTVRQGQEVTVPFTVMNAGQGNLEISSIRGTCGCTPVTLPNGTLAPGERVTAELKFNSAGRLGPQSLKFYIVSNDPVVPLAQVTVSGVVVGPAEASYPKSVYFGTVKSGTTVFQRIDFTDAAGAPLEVTGATSSSPVFEVTPVGHDTPAGKDCAVLITVSRTAPVGAAQGTVRVTTRDTTLPPIEVAVNVVVAPADSPKAVQVFLGTVKRGQAATRTVTLALPDHRAFTVREVECQDARVQCAVTPAPAGAACVLTVTLAPEAPAGTIAARVTVHPADAEAPDIPVMVYGRVVE